MMEDFRSIFLLCSVGMPPQSFGATEKEHPEILELHQDFATID